MWDKSKDKGWPKSSQVSRTYAFGLGPSPVDMMLAEKVTNLQKNLFCWTLHKERQGWEHEEVDFPDSMPKPVKSSFIVQLVLYLRNK